MKCFVDLRFQGTGARFAFWDTETSSFDDFDDYDGEVAWEDWAAFESRFRCEANDAGDLGWNEEYLTMLLQRYRSLCPSWMFDEPTDRELGFCDEADNYIDVVFDGPPSHESGRFVEVEDTNGSGVDIHMLGSWVERPNGYWALRLRFDRLVDHIGHRPSLDRAECAKKTLEWIGSTLNLVERIRVATDRLTSLRDEVAMGLVDSVEGTNGRAYWVEDRIEEIIQVLAGNAPVELAVGDDSVQPADSTRPDESDSNPIVNPSGDSDD